MKFEWKPEYENWDDIPDGAKDAYEEKGGKVVIVRALQKTQLENAYKKEQERRKKAEEANEVLKKLDGVDLETIGDDLEELQELRDLKEAGEIGSDDNKEKIEALVEKRVETERKKFERDLNKLRAENETTNSTLKSTREKLSSITLDDAISKAAAELEVKNHGLKVVKRFGRDEFMLNDEGEIVDRSDAGRTIQDWIQNEIDENPTLTMDLKSAGMGADNGGGGGGKRTYKRAEFDEIARNNPAEAAKVMASVRGGEASLVD